MKENFKELEKIVGLENFSFDPEDLIAYSRDQFSPLIGDFMPDLVVRPGSVEEVKNVIKWANEYKMPVYPASFGSNLLAMSLATRKGMVLELRRMDKILEINEKTMTAIIEPGVTWGKLRREAFKKGLEPMPLIGPYTGSPLANYIYAGCGSYDQEHFKVLGLEAILPNGEIMRTGGLALNSSVANPYISMGFGPNLTELFRISMGILGVVTKMVYRLHPIREAEEHVNIGFSNMESLMEGMMEVVRLGFAHYVFGFNQGQALVSLTSPEDFQDKSRWEEIRADLPKYVLKIGLSGKQKQVKVLKEILFEEMSSYGGKEIEFKGSMKENDDELSKGNSLAIIHMFREGPLFWPGSLIPPYRVSQWYDDSIALLKKYDIRDREGNHLIPNMWILPVCNNENVWFEQDCAFDPLDEESLQKWRKFMGAYLEFALKNGSGTLFFDPSIQPYLDPGFVNLLKGIKKIVDPNMIFAPGKI